MSGVDVHLVRGTDGDLALIASLWRSMVEHHRQVAGDELPVRGADDAWTMRPIPAEAGVRVLQELATPAAAPHGGRRAADCTP